MSWEQLDTRIVLSVSASFVPSTGQLLVLGDSLDNTIVVSRDGAGHLLINDGTVSVGGGIPTVANTTRITINGFGGNDHLTLNESNGELPAADLFGDDGDDTLVGGSNADQLFGGDGNDSLRGMGGADTLLGGAHNDFLTGCHGDDQVFGESGDDRIAWNPGDDTDLNEGGADRDAVEVNGGNGPEQFATTANGTRVRFDRVSPAPFSLDIGTSEVLVVNMNGGDDSVSAAGNLAALIQTTVEGGTGNDTILGTNGSDVLIGGDGDDFVDGQQGMDVIQLGADDDTFQWDPGDGSDMLEGGDGTDTMNFNGSAANEIFAMSANGQRLRFTRNIANIVMDIDDVEAVTVNTLGGADVVNIADLNGTDASRVNVNLAGALNGAAGDGQADVITLGGTNGDDSIDVAGGGDSYTVMTSNLLLSVLRSEAGSDSMVVNSLEGNDELDASALSAGVVRLTLDGGAGSDRITGSDGVDTILAGTEHDSIDGRMGDDTVFMGDGADRLTWNAGDGNDVVEGQGGFDVIILNGSNQNENIDITANASRLRLFHSVGNLQLDVDDVERLNVAALGGSDTITVGDLSGTDVRAVQLNLGAQGSATGDGATDQVNVNGTQSGDTIRVHGGGTDVQALPVDAMGRPGAPRKPGEFEIGSDPIEARSAARLSATTSLDRRFSAVHVDALWGLVSLTNTEATRDTLNIVAMAGDDVVDALSLKAGVIGFAASGGLGNDVLIGSDGDDLFNGGDGNDLTRMGKGNDTFVWNPGDDNDTVEGQQGLDRLLFNGSNAAESFSILANGERVHFRRDIANVTMDMDGVEWLDLATFGGADSVTIGDLSGTSFQSININFAASTGGSTADQQADRITLEGTQGDDAIFIAGAGGETTAFMPWGGVSVLAAEPDLDRMVVLSLGGDDLIDASGVATGQIGLTLDGGDDEDVLIGGAGDDTLFGGNGDDVLVGGPGVDVLDGGPGDDIEIQ